MLARDVSNYTVPLTAGLVGQWQAEGVGLVIIQAFPQSYHQYAEQRDQMAACVAAGMPYDVYVYDYFGDRTWLEGALEGINEAQSEGMQMPRRLWLDVEDTETEEGWSPGQRIEVLDDHLALCDTYTAALGIGQAGIYTGSWWWSRVSWTTKYMARSLWTAEYDGVADAEVFTQFGGWTECAIKQYEGTQPDGTDLNVLSEAEAAAVTGGDVTDAERQEYEDRISGLISALGLLCGDDLKPLTRKNAAAYVQTYVGQARALAEQFGVNHA